MPAWEKYIRKVEPYVPGEQPKMSDIIKLNTNENPYPPAPGVTKAMAETDIDSFRLYPDPAATDLVEAIAEEHGVGADQVFVGVGSDDVIAMAFMTFFNSDKPILFPDISYSFYSVWAEMLKIPYERPALNEKFEIVASDYVRDCGGIIFPNPNAPTSLLMPLSDVEYIVASNPDVIVIVDEAYIDFAGDADKVSALGLLDKYENLLVTRTFSKSRSMAGMRIGYAVGSSTLIKAMNDVKYSYNSYTMNKTAITTGVAAVKDRAYFNDTVGKIVATRDRACREFRNLGFSFPEPSSNFIFVSHKSKSAKELFEALKREGIYVRYFNQPRIDNYLRVTIGTDTAMDKLFEALRKLTAE